VIQRAREKDAMAHVLHLPRFEPPVARAAHVARGAARFGLHLLEMCAIMCIGIAVLDVPFLAAAKSAGVSDPATQLPELTALVVAFNMSLPMALWMRVRHHHKRCIQEMSAAMFIEAAILIVAAAIGLLPRDSLVAWQHSLMVPAMVVAMLLRLHVYTQPVRGRRRLT
jgi:hypothetical protein